jgi:curli production assembly/transport component CsgF
MKKLILCVTILCFAISWSYGQDFTYQPINPAFGGNVLNYSWMLNSANSQNKLKDPNANDDDGLNTIDQFTESLNRQILNQISRELVSEQFGAEGLTEGTYQFGDFQVDITPGLDGLVILITDFANGGQTSITVPYF